MRLNGRSLSSTGILLMATIVSNPLTTLPNTTCLPAKCGQGRSETKNCEPLVLRAERGVGVRRGRAGKGGEGEGTHFLPRLAMHRRPSSSISRFRLSSSNVPP